MRVAIFHSIHCVTVTFPYHGHCLGEYKHTPSETSTASLSLTRSAPPPPSYTAHVSATGASPLSSPLLVSSIAHCLPSFLTSRSRGAFFNFFSAPPSRLPSTHHHNSFFRPLRTGVSSPPSFCTALPPVHPVVTLPTYTLAAVCLPCSLSTHLFSPDLRVIISPILVLSPPSRLYCMRPCHHCRRPSPS